MLRTAEVTARLKGTPAEIFAVVADYDLYHSWIPGLDHSRVLTQEGDVAVAELRASRHSPRSFALELVGSAPSAVTFRQIDSLDAPALSGRWEIGAAGGDGAAAAEAMCRVKLRLTLETPLLQLASHRRMKAALAATLDALGERRHELAAGDDRTAAVRRQKVLEVVREPRGIRVWYLGETYLLSRTEEGGG